MPSAELLHWVVMGVRATTPTGALGRHRIDQRPKVGRAGMFVEAEQNRELVIDGAR